MTDIQPTIEYRKVRNIRLEYGIAGLKVIVPLKFNGKITEVLSRHSNWISIRQKQILSLQKQFEGMALENRTDQLLRVMLRPLVADSVAAIGMQPNLIKYRNMKSRWGSCSSKGVITFSTRLKYLPEKLVAFVVHHEISHLKVMRHDKKFWNLMAEKFPDYRAMRKELQLYGMLLSK